MEKLDKIFYDNQEFNVLFRCRQCKFSMYESVAKLLRQSYHVAKLLATYSTTITSISCSLNLFLKLSLYIEFVCTAQIEFETLV